MGGVLGSNWRPLGDSFQHSLLNYSRSQASMDTFECCSRELGAMASVCHLAQGQPTITVSSLIRGLPSKLPPPTSNPNTFLGAYRPQNRYDLQRSTQTAPNSSWSQVILHPSSQGNCGNTSSPLNTSIAQSMTETRQVPLSVFIQATASPPGVMTEILY